MTSQALHCSDVGRWLCQRLWRWRQWSYSYNDGCIMHPSEGININNTQKKLPSFFIHKDPYVHYSSSLSLSFCSTSIRTQYPTQNCHGEFYIKMLKMNKNRFFLCFQFHFQFRFHLYFIRFCLISSLIANSRSCRFSSRLAKWTAAIHCTYFFRKKIFKWRTHPLWWISLVMVMMLKSIQNAVSLVWTRILFKNTLKK